MADLFDIAVARKLSGGGGGGSSDFSTATVTLVNNTGAARQFDMAVSLFSALSDDFNIVIGDEYGMMPEGSSEWKLIIPKNLMQVQGGELLQSSMGVASNLTNCTFESASMVITDVTQDASITLTFG